eukprot:m.28710 g.28710  ORF g.28710 m.28710 type:complete len:346 (-) comp13627_c0_seq3:40-1077(-)
MEQVNSGPIGNSDPETGSTQQQNSGKRGDASILDVQLVWSIILPATAECVISEFLPVASTQHGLDIASTSANIFGAYLEGALFGMERQTSSVPTAQLCVKFRLLFMNVFTSFPFVAVHGAEMCVLNGFLMGVGYVLTSLVLAIVAFEAGRRASEGAIMKLRSANTESDGYISRLGTTEMRAKILYSFIGFIGLSLTKANWLMALSLTTQNDHNTASQRTLETLTGILFAISGVVLGGYISSTCRANFMSCFLVAVAFATHRMRTANPLTGTLAMVFAKFVGSFCGAISGFAAMLSDMGVLIHSDLNPNKAVVGIAQNILICILWMLIFYAFDRHGLDVYSYALKS